MKDILIRKNGHVGHITLNRPKALNALTYEMILEIEKALISWKENTKIKLKTSDFFENLSNHVKSFSKLFWKHKNQNHVKKCKKPKN